MKIGHLPATTTADAVAAALVRDGAVIVDGLAAVELMDRLDGELRPFIDAAPFGPDEFAGRHTRRAGALVARSATCRELILHPLVKQTAKRVLHQAKSFQLHLTQVIAIEPGEKAQTIHRDQWAFDYFPFPKGYEVQLNTLWAMTDFTEENGATRVVPGSNHSEDLRRLTEADTVPAEMSRGSVLFYTGSVYHGGGANRSSKTRCGLNLTYNVSWLRQEENQYLSCPPEVAKTLPVELLRLMGYAYGAYALGYVGDLKDPIETVRPDLAKTNVGAVAGGASDPAPRRSAGSPAESRDAVAERLTGNAVERRGALRQDETESD